ncbi:MAG: peptide/nickel transport system permease protein [Solirubrobacteraceae bacterium]|jgi:peptide/nickel transport system permease protein|nr:peptide/nickel transport system permease protein [Solirubrobacteraceae bacterium]
MEAVTELTPEAQRLAPGPIAVGRRGLARQLVADRTALVGLVIVAIVVVVALAAPVLAPQDPDIQDVAQRLQGPSAAHLLGTDYLGRDELSRLLYGARVSLLTTLAVGCGILVLGMLVGTVAGMAGGFVDGFLMRIVDVLLAFPSLLLALAVAGTLGPGLLHLALAVTAIWWVDYARLVRGLVLVVKQQPFVEASRALGVGPLRIAVRHVVPNIASPVVVLATLQTARLLLALATLSFLGLGVSPPTAEWGAMLNDGKDFLSDAPALMLWPGLAITITALGLNLLGDGLRDLLDPSLR